MLTPLDFQGKEFLKTFRGYDTEEVDKFFALVARDFERLYQDNVEIKAANARASNKIEYFEQMEMTMNTVISIAQETAADVKRTGKKQVESLRQVAEANAAKLIAEAKVLSQEEIKSAEKYSLKTREEADNYSLKVRKAADEEAEKILAEAKKEANNIIKDAQNIFTKNEQEIAKRKNTIDNYQIKIKELLKEELDIITKYEQE
jgi:DivIVA domain-containing protein